MPKNEAVKILIKFVREFAQKHYDNGGDCVVDYMEDRDILDFLRDIKNGKTIKDIKAALLQEFKFHKKYMEEEIQMFLAWKF